jgi:hypothetical protein
MQIHEILDRLELLYPTSAFFTDLRKVILNDDKFALFRIVQDKKDSQLLEGLRKYKDDETFNSDCFSRGQLESKLWLVRELENTCTDLGTVFLCAGWYATLATMLFESKLNVNKIRSFDIDESCVKVAETFNFPWYQKEWQFKALVQDIMDIDYNEHKWQFWSNKNNRMSYPITDIPDTIINTSCEHIVEFDKWYTKIPKDKLVVLQSNNFFEVDEHVNCSKDLVSFANQTPMTKVLYEGELSLEKYTRYMRIGYV